MITYLLLMYRRFFKITILLLIKISFEEFYINFEYYCTYSCEYITTNTNMKYTNTNYDISNQLN